jgi:hypothetical protein
MSLGSVAAKTNVCFWGKTGPHLLVLRISGFDPKRTLTVCSKIDFGGYSEGRISNYGDGGSPALANAKQQENETTLGRDCLVGNPTCPV